MSPTIARRRRYVTNFWMISPAMRVLSRKKSSANRSTGIRIRPASCLDRLGNQFDGIAVAPQVLPIRRAREHAYAMQIVGGCGHRIIRSEEHTSELQSPCNLVCRLLLEKNKAQHRRVPGRCLGCCRPTCSPRPAPPGAVGASQRGGHRTRCVVLQRLIFCFFFLKTGPPPNFSLFPHRAALLP